MFLTPSEVKVSWKTAIDSVEKYDVTYKPTDASYRVVVVVAGNSDSVTLTGLTADTQYSVTVTAVRGGKKFKSRPVVFRTLGKNTDYPYINRPWLPTPQEQQVQITGNPPGGGTKTNSRSNMPPPYLQVRGIEVGIVCLVLLVWVGSIVLFFNRWGKIRMLLPYQPDYKDTQLKVPGSGACQLGGPSCQNTPGTAFCCPQVSDHRRFTAAKNGSVVVDYSIRQVFRRCRVKLPLVLNKKIPHGRLGVYGP
ncbi:hypothetical protein AAG570_009765 [Ranatra chinensis]|uniref:Fibronectin type-III domain-containing protein n=1 Tax=Ranatra chinensis TaxID=642074 RepID=A0ABD0YQA4_9HEMI